MMDIGALKNCIGGLAKNVYFCGSNANDLVPTLYVKDKKTRLQLTELFQKKAQDDPSFGLIKIETTRSLKLKRTRSLEEILTRVPHQTIFFDPTATIERANVLVCIAKQARQLLGPVLKGCYFNSEKRNIYFLIKADNSTEEMDLSAILAQLEPILLSNTQQLSRPFYYTISISVQKPQGLVVAVDNLSVVKGDMKRIMKTLINKLKWPLLLLSASSLGMTAATAKSTDASLKDTTATAKSTKASLHGKVTTAKSTKSSLKGKAGAAKSADDPSDPSDTAKSTKSMPGKAGAAKSADDPSDPSDTAKSTKSTPGKAGAAKSADDDDLFSGTGAGAGAASTLKKYPWCKKGPPPPPAVVNPNFWLGGAGGYLHNNRDKGGAGYAEGGFATRLKPGFGIQFHGYIGGVRNGANLQSIDGYVFWRNPCRGLVGPHLTYTAANDFHHFLLGIQAEAYLWNWTLTGELGDASRSNNKSNGAYGEAIINWYPTPDWRFYVGGIDINGEATGQVGTEYLFGLSSLPGLSIFADAGVGAHNLRYGFIGLRYYFGDVCDPCKTLIRRHREDMIPATIDPINRGKKRLHISHM